VEKGRNLAAFRKLNFDQVKKRLFQKEGKKNQKKKATKKGRDCALQFTF